ncbi:MAG: peptidase M15 [Oligoflexia bacterium]|nr:peptidase M15 [Oligoflexia bacterium]MBF0365785.1 peptidase M15 [Oligoflexia bacterium]
MQLSPHFTLEEATFSETATRLGIVNIPNEQQKQNMIFAAQKLEHVRSLLKYPLKINSWFRTEKVNSAIGGAKSSSHLDGHAIDFSCSGFGSPHAVCIYLSQQKIEWDQVILEYNQWTHISFDPKNRKQLLTIFNPQKIYALGIWSKDEYTKKIV